MKAIVYILHSAALGNYYIGFSANFEKRLENHEQHSYGTHKFTSKAKDWKLFLKIECETILQAKGIEAHIKRMKSKMYIENLKKYPEMIEKVLEPV